MTREIDPRLKELYDKGVPIYSISRIDSINNCLYGAYLTYKLHKKGSNNVYAIMGGKIHDILEGITNGENTEEDLLPAMQAELEDMDTLDISFPKDAKGGDSIREGWITDMEHFCTTYKAPKSKNLSTEELFIYQTSKGYYLQGYIDLQNLKKKGLDIYDYKTSTLYKGEDLKAHGRQLVIYQMGKEQEDKQVDSVAWIFLKYVDVEFMGYKTAKSKEKTLLTKTIERKKIGTELEKYVERDLIDAGYDEFDTEIYLNEFKKTNKFECLPKEIQTGYKMKPCVLKYEVTDEVKQECEDYINTTIEMWESLGDDVKNYPPRSFTKTQKNGKVVSNIFFCTQLCSHGKECPYLRDYLDTLDKTDNEDDDLF